MGIYGISILYVLGIKCYQRIEDDQINYARQSQTNPSMTRIVQSILKAIETQGNMNFLRSPILSRMSGGNTEKKLEVKECVIGSDICMTVNASVGLLKDCATLHGFNEGLSTIFNKSLQQDGCIMFTDEDNEKIRDAIMKEDSYLQLEEQKKYLEEMKEQYPDVNVDDQIAMIEKQIQEIAGFWYGWVCICSTDGCNDNMLQPGFELNPSTNQTSNNTTKMDLFNPISNGTTEISQPQPTTQEPGNETGGETSEISQPQPTTHRLGNETRGEEQKGNEAACIHSNLLQVAFVLFIFISMI